MMHVSNLKLGYLTTLGGMTFFSIDVVIWQGSINGQLWGGKREMALIQSDISRVF